MPNKPAPVPQSTIVNVSRYLGIDEQIVTSKAPTFSASPSICQCGRNLDFLDFAKTAFNHGIHEKKFMGEFFSSDKSMEKEMDISIVCQVCDRLNPVHVMYRYSGPHTCS